MRIDLHNHTVFCKHAKGTMEGYIQKAIEIGIDIFGFSDHAPMPYDPRYRMDITQKNSYELKVKELQDIYKDSIEVLLGYEVDFMQNKSLMLDEILSSKVDYLIGSVHFLQDKNSNFWGFDNPEFISKYKEKNIDDIWLDYFDSIEQLAKSKLFDIVGHIDLIKIFNYLPSKDIRLLAKSAMKSIKKANMTIEINSAGFGKPIKEPYPSRQLLELAFDLNIPITFGSDAHSINQVGFKYDEVKALAKELGFLKCARFKERQRELVAF